MHSRLERVGQSIVDLGFATRERLEELIHAYSARLLQDTSTVDEDGELSGFLGYLQAEGVLSPPQLRGLLTILAGPAGAPAAPEDPLIGRRFGDFVTVSRLGEGAMGQVYRARKTGDPGPAGYVVKLFVPPEDAQELERIRREGALLLRLDHPNVVRCHGAGKEGEQHYLVLEYVAGATLQQVMEQRRRIPWEGASRAMLQLAAALAAVHEQGIVHRDVKPHNVLVARDGTLKLCDFGLAKDAEAVQVRSRAGMILGSPAYIAPEQWGDHDVDARADLFALGVLYYFLLTGVFPFRGRTPAEFAVKIQRGDFPPVEALCPGIPPAVSWIVTQLLERDRRYRTPSAQRLLADLDAALRGEQPEVPRLERPDGERFPLLGKDLFRVGRATGSELRLEGLAEVHAQLERTVAGLLLRTVDPEAEVSVAGQRLQGEVVLKPGDAVRFGPFEEPYTYREGNLAVGAAAPERRPTGEYTRSLKRPQPHRAVELPGLVVDALSDAGHPLALLACIEELDGRSLTASIERSIRSALRAGVDEGAARRAALRARQIGVRRREWISNCLFHTTYENLGPDAQPWLAWWWDARERYALQARPLEPAERAFVDVETPDGERRRVALHGPGEEWTLGRSLKTEVSIPDSSVSRAHARLLRLARGYAFRDLGSRQGVRIEGARRDLGLLVPGDALTIGRAVVRFFNEPTAPPDQLDPGVDRLTFTALVELRSPHTAAALVALLDPEGLAVRYRQPLETLVPGASAGLLANFLGAQRLMALEALPLITGAQLGLDAAAWTAWWREHAELMPQQVRPWGWPAGPEG
ncbi:MAG: protein kinase [Planctomycetota bacterium]